MREAIRTVAALIFVVAVFSCSDQTLSGASDEPDIRLNAAHCIISEADQEPIVIDAHALELFSDSNTVLMRGASFRQNKRGSDEPSIVGTAGFLRLDSKSQDVRLSGGVVLHIYTDGEKTRNQGSQASSQENQEEPYSQDVFLTQEGDGVISEFVDQESSDSYTEGDNEVSDEGVREILEDERRADEDESVNRIEADEILWGKYTRMLESPNHVLLQWEGTVVRGIGFKGDLNAGEFSFESVTEGIL